MPELHRFSLVGGTALALRYGHRKSIDLDLFCHEPFDRSEVIQALQTNFHKDFVYEGAHSHFGIFCYIADIKVDIVHYPHAPIFPIDEIDNVRMYRSEDIACMKIQAMLGRGKKKDFWDLSELFAHYSLRQIISWHEQKYPGQMLLISIPQAITYFDDAEESEDPVSLKGQTWEQVKQTIQQEVSRYLS